MTCATTHHRAHVNAHFKRNTHGAIDATIAIQLCNKLQQRDGLGLTRSHMQSVADLVTPRRVCRPKDVHGKTHPIVDVQDDVVLQPLLRVVKHEDKLAASLPQRHFPRQEACGAGLNHQAADLLRLRVRDAASLLQEGRPSARQLAPRAVYVQRAHPTQGCELALAR